MPGFLIESLFFFPKVAENSDVTKPRLLVVTSTYPRWLHDSEPAFVHELSKRLVEHFEVTVVCPAARSAACREILDGVQVRRFRYAPDRFQTLVNDGGMVTNLKRNPWKWALLPGFLVAQFLAVWRQVRRVRPHVVHAHWLVPQGLILALLCVVDRSAPPFIVTSHGADLYALRGRPWIWMKRFVGRRAAALAVVSSGMRDELSTQRVDCSEVIVEPMGVDLQGLFSPDAQVQRSRHELLFVGRLVEKKGLKFLIDALPAILEKEPLAHLTIAGFGPQREELETQAFKRGVSEHVSFLGAVSQSDLPRLYRRAAIFVAPFVQAKGGDQEGLGLVMIEAMGCGCPVIAGGLPAIRDVIPNQNVGRIVPPASVEPLVSAVCELLGDEAARDRIAINARSWAMERFDWSRAEKGYASILERYRSR